jgi:hypothetical protein
VVQTFILGACVTREASFKEMLLCTGHKCWLLLCAGVLVVSVGGLPLLGPGLP